MAGTLEDRDVDRLMAAVAELTPVRTVDQLRRDTVALLPDLISTNLVGWNDLDLDTGAMAVVAAPEAPSFDPTVWAAHVGDHPVVAYYNATNDGRPYAISDFLDEDAFHRTGIYEHVYRQLRAEDQLSFVLPHPRLIVGIALNRPERGFSARDRRVANLLRPFLVQAHRNAAAFERSRLLLDHLDHALAVEGEGVAVCDRRGRLLERTDGAATLLAAWFPGAPPGRLPGELVDWLGAERTVEGRGWPLVREREGVRLKVRRLPGRTAATAILHLAETRTDREELALARVGLTRRQAQVMAVLAEGASNAEIAGRLGISHRTVDKHVQAGFARLGVANRTAAANLVRQLDAPLSPPLPGGPVAGALPAPSSNGSPVGPAPAVPPSAARR